MDVAFSSELSVEPGVFEMGVIPEDGVRELVRLKVEISTLCQPLDLRGRGRRTKETNDDDVAPLRGRPQDLGRQLPGLSGSVGISDLVAFWTTGVHLAEQTRAVSLTDPPRKTH